jgi:protein SCO1
MIRYLFLALVGATVAALIVLGILFVRGMPRGGEPAIGVGAQGAPRLTPVGEVGDFALAERSGAPLKRADLAGKIWVADFIFTRCAGPCPKMSAAIQGLETKLRDLPDLRFVSFTLDPAYDTPAVLAKYADAHAAPRDRWLFATGPRDALVRLSIEGFKLGASDDDGEVIHSSRFILVDRRGRIRGYYDGTGEEDPGAIERLIADARALHAEPPAP